LTDDAAKFGGDFSRAVFEVRGGSGENWMNNEEKDKDDGANDRKFA
jgi:hypothetical protein